MTDDERRLLELLAAGEATDKLLLIQGFKLTVIFDVVQAGLATAKTERAFAAGRTVEITTLRITEAGRLALAVR
jgi:hypothetical protein